MHAQRPAAQYHEPLPFHHSTLFIHWPIIWPCYGKCDVHANGQIKNTHEKETERVTEAKKKTQQKTWQEQMLKLFI